MIINLRKHESEWRKWFALWPVQVGQYEFAWMQFVQTKIGVTPMPYIGTTLYERVYRLDENSPAYTSYGALFKGE